MSTHKKQNFLYGSVILIVSTVIVKLIGCLFKIPLQNLIGATGMGYFSTSYSLFNLFYALSVAGLPMAVARMVAKSSTNHEYKNVRKILKIANISFIITGLVGSILMACLAKIYVNTFTSNPDAYWCTIMMAPSILFCCISSAYRGYYEGLQNMYPTAISQVIEAVFKLIIGYFAAKYIMTLGWQQYYQTGHIFGEIVTNPNDAENIILKFAAAGAIFGITISTFLGALYIFIRHITKGDGILKSNLKDSLPAESTQSIFKQLLKISIPICLAAAVMNIAAFIDTKTMVQRLSIALSKNSDIILSQYHGLIPSNMSLSKIPNFLYGAYTGMSINLYNFIPSLTTAFSISILPVITAAITKNDRDALKQNMECVLRITTLLCAPPSLALIVLANPILISLYGSRVNEAMIAVFPLRLLGVAALLVSLVMPINSMLQAIGKVNAPAKLMIIGVCFKLLINKYLISLPSININGAPIGTIFCYSIVVVLGLYILLKTTSVSLNIKSVFIKPIFGSIICVAAAYLSLQLLNKISFLKNIHHGLISVIIAIIISVFIYIISLFLLRAIEKNDIKMLPGGKIFLKTLEKYHFFS